MNYINPTYQKPNPPTLAILIDAVKREIKRDLNCVKVGVVQSFDAATQEIVAQIAQQQVTSISPTGVRTLAEYPVLLRVPVQFPSGGGFTLTFPIAAGDECILLFNDRELDNWLINGAGLAPTSGRVHDISDGMAIVGIRSNPRALAGVSTSTTQLRSDDGETYVEVAGGGIVNVVAPTSIILNTPEVIVTGIIEVQNTNSEAIPCTVTGSIHSTGDMVANGISLDSHHHTGVTTGSGNTGGPA